MKKISIIVPVYKVEPYLRMCIESLVSQTYRNLEIILVDDGSPDGCPAICDEYALNDSRIKVVHQENGGLSDARNTGLEIATGEYVAFVDSDDWVEKDMYEKLISAIERTGADVAASNFYYYEDNLNRIGMSKTNNDCVLVNREEIFHYLVGGDKCLRFEVWNKLFKKEVIGDIRFKKGQIYEDLYFDRMVFSNCSKICRIDDCLYHYRFSRPGNTVTMFNRNKLNKFSEIKEYVNLFSRANESRLANEYSYYGFKTSIQFYYRAKKYKANNEILSQIKVYSTEFYEGIYPKTNFLKIKYHLFFYFPCIYKLHIDLVNYKKRKSLR